MCFSRRHPAVAVGYGLTDCREAAARRARGGFVLVMALAMIVLAGFLLARMARQSLGVASEAVAARSELQRRWGAISCQRVFLDRADDLFDALQASAEGGEALSPLAPPIQLKLGGMTFNLLLADENSKVNLNTAYARRGEEEVIRLCRQSASDLRPDPRPGGGRAFDCWAQVFAPADDETGATPSRALADATTSITCWGDGRLNLRRAPDRLVRAVGRLAVSDNTVRELLAIRRQHPEWRARDWLRGVALDQQAHGALSRLFSEESRCYSLWIEMASPGRTWSEFVVVESSPDAADRVSRFIW